MMDLSLVLSADPWEIPDERTGEIRKGLSIWFVNSYRDSDSGLKPTKVSGDVALWDQLRGRLPAVCSLSFSTRPGQGARDLAAQALGYGNEENMVSQLGTLSGLWAYVV